MTAELVIDSLVNNYEYFLYPSATCLLSFDSPPVGRTLTERFVVYAYKSTPVGSGESARMEHKIDLIGAEYFKDRDNTVQMSFKNVPGTEAVRSIHDRYLATNGPLRMSTSMGNIGKTISPHVVNNLRPIKAIHDILDKIVFAAYKTAAPVYFRDKDGYRVGPLQELIETSSVDGTFEHNPSQGTSLAESLEGYNRIIHIKPRSPEGKSKPTGVSSTTQDLFSGEYRHPGFFGSVGEAISKYAGRLHHASWDETRQSKSVSKVTNGHWVEQEKFVAALDDSKKYYFVVPLQTGINITAGRRIRCVFPTSSGKIVDHTLFVPRLTHEVKFTRDDERKVIGVQAVSEIYTVLWQGM